MNWATLISDILTGLGIMLAVSGLVLMVAYVIVIMSIRRSVKNRVYAIFFETNRQISTELLRPKEKDIRVEASDKATYLIDRKKAFWFMWPPGFPDSVKEPIPCLVYSRGNPEAYDPGDPDTKLTAKSLQFLTDEGMLKQAWKDARASTESLNPSNTKVIYYVIGFLALLLLGIMYFVWAMSSQLEGLQRIITGG